MTEEEKKFIKNVNVDKAKNKTTGAIFFSIVSLVTYIVPFFFGEFDFGIIFEVISLVFLIIARNKMNDYDEVRAKRYIICSIASIGWILIYDVLLFISSIQDALDFAFVGFDYIFSEGALLIYIMILFFINKDLVKADNPEKHQESTDWFYERLDKK